MESGSVLSEPAITSQYQFNTERLSPMTIISSNGSTRQPRMSQLETLEAKMANIEVSLSSSNINRRRKGTSLGGTISARSSPRPEIREQRSALQDREAVIQNLRIQLGLGKLPRPTGPPFDDSERPAAEQRLARLKNDAENKKIAIRNLKSALDKLDITDNIDIRIRQAELEYALGREELQLLSIVEEARALQTRLDKSKSDYNCLFSLLQSGVNLSLHAIQSTIGRWTVCTKSDSPGLYIDWVQDGENLCRGDRLLEVNGNIIVFNTKEELKAFLGSSLGKCQLVVIRKKLTNLPQQQLVQQQEDNLRLQHRISYLEEQVREMQAVKDTINGKPNTNGKTGHVTSINISTQPTVTAEKPQVFQRGSYVTTLVGGKPIEFTPLKNTNTKNHITKTLIKENGCHTDTENYTGSIRNLSASKISISSDIGNQIYRRERERNSIQKKSKYNQESQRHNHNYQIPSQKIYSHARSVEHLNYNGNENSRDERKTVSRRYGNDLRSVKSLDFDSETNDRNDRKYNIDYTSEPDGPKIRPTPPKKPLRLSLQRAQSLQTVEISQISDNEKKRHLKRVHHSSKKHQDQGIGENGILLQTASLGRHSHV